MWGEVSHGVAPVASARAAAADWSAAAWEMMLCVKLLHYLVRDVSVGIYVLYIIEVFEHVDQPEDFLCTILIQGHCHRGNHGNLSVGRLEAGSQKCVFDIEIIFEGCHHIERAVVIGLNVFCSRSEERRVGKECRFRWGADHD